MSPIEWALLAAYDLAILLLIFMVLSRTPGPNRYGPDPRQRESAMA